MKYTKTFEAFTKSYGEKISTANFKDIPIGKSILYMGSPHEVIDNDGFVLTLNDQDGNTLTVNLNQFNRGGQINEAANIKKTIHDHWFDTYGKQFITEYPGIAKILKTRPTITRDELARIWDETHEENFEKTHPKIWDKLG